MLYPRAYIYFSLVLVLAAIGFYPSYFSRMGSVNIAHHFHAAIAIAWMLMLISQSWAINHGRVGWHRTAGKFSYLLAPLFVSSGVVIIQAMHVGDGAFREMFGSGLALVDAIAVITFAWLYYAAISNRRNMQLHGRYMSATVLMLISPALSRALSFYVPGLLVGAANLEEFTVNLHLGNAAALVAALVLLFRDRHTVGIKPPYVVTAIALALQSIAFELFADSGAWRTALAGLEAVSPVTLGAIGLTVGILLAIAANRRGAPMRTAPA